MRQARGQGRLRVIAGPMFAGKTSALIALARRQELAAPGSVLALKPAFDTRGGAELIASRDSSTLLAQSVSCWPEAARRAAMVVLDEAQFLVPPHYDGDVVADVRRAVAGGAEVTVSGLDTDYLRNPFAVIQDCLALADERVMLQARCHVCGDAASWTAKKSETGRLLEVGDSALYDARCDRHWSLPD